MSPCLRTEPQPLLGTHGVPQQSPSHRLLLRDSRVDPHDQMPAPCTPNSQGPEGAVQLVPLLPPEARVRSALGLLQNEELALET